MTFNIEFFQVMTEEKTNNGNGTKSDIFPWDIFKPDTVSFLIKEY